MLQIVLEAVCGKLAADAVAGAAHADALRVAALDHKAGDDAVKDHAVVKALADQRNKVIDGIGRDLGVKLRLDDAAVLHFDGDDWIHGKPS